MTKKPKLIILTGATASGKSAFVYEALSGLNLTVINADSRQIYKDITIASASPKAGHLEKFPHALYNFLPITESFSAGEFMRAAKAEIDRAHAANRIPVICGGTYFYLHALLYGLLPQIQIPENVWSRIEQMSGAVAYEELSRLDAVAAKQNHPHNVVRTKRALALCLAHGGPISNLPKVGGIAGSFETLMLIFDMKRDTLRERTAKRVGEMFALGLVSEIQSLMADIPSGDITPWRKIPALTGIGIREFFEIREKTGKLPAELSAQELAQTEKAIATNTIHLVKRQQTWYKNASPKPAGTKTVDPSYEKELIAALVKDFVSLSP